MLDPTSDDPWEHLRLSPGTGFYQSLTTRGEVSIDVLGLNRGTLPRGRLAALRAASALMREWLEARAAGDQGRALFEQRALLDQPFADVVYMAARMNQFPAMRRILPARLSEALDQHDFLSWYVIN
ncbi:hypothetical protein [Kineosporia babensis]|uniref:Uncharacterized protein n=1 Tax=Kineosporia babensis TaxID=499548 RepID=A0A9X1NHM7_9ACTN|nr:hypothetical protein [Kineosporia babensis]MCD5314039.1 hypothetical protein [Kineosporia babensis]